MGFYKFVDVDTPFDPDLTVVTSNILSPNGLKIYRGLVALYAVASLITDIVFDIVVDKDIQKYLSFFTNLSWIGITIYYVNAFLQSRSFVRSRSQNWQNQFYPRSTREYKLQESSRFIQFLYMFLFTTIVVFPPVVTTTFWLLLASPTTFRSPFTIWSNITFHALNSVFALSEIILSRMRPRWGHLPFLILTLGGFLGVAYLTLLTQGFVPYPFLEPSQGAAKLAIAIGGMTAANIGVFVVVWLLCFLRDKFLGRRAQGRGRYAQVNEMTAGVF